MRFGQEGHIDTLLMEAFEYYEDRGKMDSIRV